MDKIEEDARGRILGLVRSVLNVTSSKDVRSSSCLELFNMFGDSDNAGVLLSMSDKLYQTLEQPMFKHDEMTSVKETLAICLGELGSVPGVEDFFMGWLNAQLVKIPESLRACVGANNSALFSSAVSAFIEGMSRRRSAGSRSGAAALAGVVQLVARLLLKDVELMADPLSALALRGGCVSLPPLLTVSKVASAWLASVLVDVSSAVLHLTVHPLLSKPDREKGCSIILSLASLWTPPTASSMVLALVTAVETVGDKVDKITALESFTAICTLLVTLTPLNPYPPLSQLFKALVALLDNRRIGHAWTLPLMDCLLGLSRIIPSSLAVHVSPLIICLSKAARILPRSRKHAAINCLRLVLHNLSDTVLPVKVQPLFSFTPTDSMSASPLALGYSLVTQMKLSNEVASVRSVMLLYASLLHNPKYVGMLVECLLVELRSLLQTSSIRVPSDQLGNHSITRPRAIHALIAFDLSVLQLLATTGSVAQSANEELQDIVCQQLPGTTEDKNDEFSSEGSNILWFSLSDKTRLLVVRACAVLATPEESPSLRLLYLASLATSNAEILGTALQALVKLLRCCKKDMRFGLIGSHVLDKDGFVLSLSSSSKHENKDIRMLAGRLFAALRSNANIVFSGWDLSLLKRAAVERLSDSEEEVRVVFLEYLSHWNDGYPNVSNNDDHHRNVLQKRLMAVDPKQGVGTAFNQNLRHCVLRLPSGSMKPHDFQRIFETITKRVASGTSPWTKQLLDIIASTLPEPPIDDAIVLSAIASDESLASFWAVWEAAKFCVASKLRTPYGNATATFEAIEHMVTESSKDPGNIDLAKLSLVLGFVESLDRQLYVAYEGALCSGSGGQVAVCSFRYPSMPTSALVFARSNRTVCTDWLSRLRPHLLYSSELCGLNSSAIRHGLRRLSDIQRRMLRMGGGAASAEAEVGSESASEAMKAERAELFLEMDKTLVKTIAALMRVKSSDAIVGIQAWSQRMCNLSNRAIGGDDAFVGGAPLLAGAADRLSWISGAMSMARGNIEQGVELLATYLQRLHRGEIKFSSKPVIEFVVETIIQSYTSLEDWEGMSAWLAVARSFGAELGQVIRANDIGASDRGHYLQALMAYDDGETASALRHMDHIAYIASDESGRTSSASYAMAVRRSEYELLSGILHLSSSPSSLKASTSLATSMVEGDVLQHCNRAASLLTAPLRAAVGFSASYSLSNQNIVDQLPVGKLECSSLLLQLHSISILKGDRRVSDAAVGIKRLAPEDFQPGDWNKLLRVTKACKQDARSSELILEMAKLSRRQGNLRLSGRLYQKMRVLQDKGLLDAWLTPVLRYEVAMLNAALGNVGEAALDLARLGIMESLSSTAAIAKSARACLTLSDWISRDYRSALADEPSVLEQIATAIDVPSTVAIPGALLHRSTKLNPSIPMTWFKLAGWSYRQALLCVDRQANKAKEMAAFVCAHSSLMVGSEGHKEAVREGLALQRRVMSSTEAKLSDAVDYSLALSRVWPWADLSLIGEVSGKWIRNRDEMVQFYKSSASSYFEFLRLGSLSESSEGSAASDAANVSSAMTATLRLLRLLVAYGGHLREILTEGLSSTPVQPWACIVPQLFSRLGHEDLHVQREVQDLLERIGALSPHLVVYSSVVRSEDASAISVSTSGDDADGPDTLDDGDDSEELKISAAGSNEITMARSKAITASLSRLHPALVGEVVTLIAELNRLSVLWDELWIDLLAKLEHEAASTFKWLAKETARVNASASLTTLERERIIRTKYDALVKPMVTQLQALIATTIKSEPPHTPYEANFIAKHASSIISCLAWLQNPADLADPSSVSSRAFKSLQAAMSSKRQSSQGALIKLGDVSPRLLSLSSGLVSMPGLYSSDSDEPLVTIKSFGEEVAVLSTKTRPKRITAIGSNGVKFAFLVKGRDDLHLDERMMQLVSIVNDLLAGEESTSMRHLRARHYAVTPIAARAGVIQWVNGVTPLFRIYKDWQLRTIAAQQAVIQSGAGAGAPNSGGSAAMKKAIVPPTPSEQFFAKLIPELKAKGVDVTSRSDWPLPVLRKVLTQLRSETPNTLLKEELWVSSAGPEEWWGKRQQYSRSLAVMSMVGYIIGLGDRHLDNMLVDIRSGEVLHIDYSVCFDKGQKLRVPERVPFRLTPMLHSALGITGVDGTFRIGCENVLRTLRLNQETLLTLLEAFIYDPLVDWTQDSEDHAARARMDFGVSLSLLSSRVDEIKTPFAETSLALAQAMQRLINSLAATMQLYIQVNSRATRSADLQRMIAAANDTILLSKKQIESHAAAVAVAREKVQHSTAQLKQSRSVVLSLLQEASKKVDVDALLVSTLMSDRVAAAARELSTVPSTCASSCQLLKEIKLSPASAALTPEAATSIFGDLDAPAIEAAVTRRVALIGRALASLDRFREMLNQLGASYSQRFVNVQWRDWLGSSLMQLEAAGTAGSAMGISNVLATAQDVLGISSNADVLRGNVMREKQLVESLEAARGVAASARTEFNVIAADRENLSLQLSHTLMVIKERSISEMRQSALATLCKQHSLLQSVVLPHDTASALHMFATMFSSVIHVVHLVVDMIGDKGTVNETFGASLSQSIPNVDRDVAVLKYLCDDFYLTHLPAIHQLLRRHYSTATLHLIISSVRTHLQQKASRVGDLMTQLSRQVADPRDIVSQLAYRRLCDSLLNSLSAESDLTSSPSAMVDPSVVELCSLLDVAMAPLDAATLTLTAEDDVGNRCLALGTTLKNRLGIAYAMVGDAEKSFRFPDADSMLLSSLTVTYLGHVDSLLKAKLWGSGVAWLGRVTSQLYVKFLGASSPSVALPAWAASMHSQIAVDPALAEAMKLVETYMHSCDALRTVEMRLAGAKAYESRLIKAVSDIEGDLLMHQWLHSSYLTSDDETPLPSPRDRLLMDVSSTMQELKDSGHAFHESMALLESKEDAVVASLSKVDKVAQQQRLLERLHIRKKERAHALHLVASAESLICPLLDRVLQMESWRDDSRLFNAALQEFDHRCVESLNALDSNLRTAWQVHEESQRASSIKDQAMYASAKATSDLTTLRADLAAVSSLPPDNTELLARRFNASVQDLLQLKDAYDAAEAFLPNAVHLTQSLESLTSRTGANAAVVMAGGISSMCTRMNAMSIALKNDVGVLRSGVKGLLDITVSQAAWPPADGLKASGVVACLGVMSAAMASQGITDSQPLVKFANIAGQASERLLALAKEASVASASTEDDGDETAAATDLTASGDEEPGEGAPVSAATESVKQSRNAHAVHVLRRLRMKLEGVSEGKAGSRTVTEHVDWLVAQAVSSDNLCVMYEGWSPWI